MAVPTQNVNLSVTFGATPGLMWLLSLAVQQLQTEPQWAKDIMAKLGEIEDKVSLADQRIATFAQDVNAKLNDINTGIDGIAGDTTTLKQQVSDLTTQLANEDLSPESQALLDSVNQTVTTLDQKVTTLDQNTPASVTAPATGDLPADPNAPAAQAAAKKVE